MGLFSRNDDGYVSPFDTDDAPDYLDPQERAEELSDAVEAAQWERERTRSAARRTSHDDARYSPPAQSPVQSPAQASAQSPADGRPAQPQRDVPPRPRADRTWRPPRTHAAPARSEAPAPTMPSAPGDATGTPPYRFRPTSKRHPIAAIVQIVITLVVVAVIVAAFDHVGGIFRHLTGETTYHIDRGSSDDDPYDYDVFGVSDQPTVMHVDGIDLALSGMRGRFRIEAAQRGPTLQPSGASTVLVTYSWDNIGDDSASFTLLAQHMVFQDGRELAGTRLYPEYGDTGLPEDYDGSADLTDIDPGDSQRLMIAYILDRDDAPIDVWLADPYYNDATARRYELTPGDDGMLAGTPITDADDTTVPDTGDDPSNGDCPDGTAMSALRGYRTDGISACIVDATRGPDDYDGTPTVIVRFMWRNDGNRPTSLAADAIIGVTVNGTQLDNSYLQGEDGDADTFTYGSAYRTIQPGMTDMAVAAYELADGVESLDVTLSGYQSGALSATLPIEARQ